MTNKQPALDWLDIKAELHRRGMTLTALGMLNGLHPKALAKIKTHPHFEGQALIARFLDRKPEDLWPDRYPQRKPRIFDTAKYGCPERAKAAAAADSRKVA